MDDSDGLIRIFTAILGNETSACFSLFQSLKIILSDYCRGLSANTSVPRARSCVSLEMKMATNVRILYPIGVERASKIHSHPIVSHH